MKRFLLLGLVAVTLALASTKESQAGCRVFGGCGGKVFGGCGFFSNLFGHHGGKVFGGCGQSFTSPCQGGVQVAPATTVTPVYPAPLPSKTSDQPTPVSKTSEAKPNQTLKTGPAPLPRP